MAEDIIQPEEKPEGSAPISSEEMIYQKLASVDEERDIPPVDDLGIIDEQYQSLSNRMKESPKLSDMQTADKRLFPDLGYNHLNNIQVSRVFPDVYNPISRILVKDLIRNSDSDMRVAEAIATVNTSVSIGIDGEGRIDELGLAGVSHEENLEKEKTKNLGL